jgi:hypothetical protein
MSYRVNDSLRLAALIAGLAILSLAVLSLDPLALDPLGTSPPVARAAECAGDDCQGPPPAPAEIVPGTAVVEGPQNPPVHFPKPHSKRHEKHAQGKHREPPHRHRGRQ